MFSLLGGGSYPSVISEVLRNDWEGRGGLGGKEGRELQDVGCLEGFGSPDTPPPPRNRAQKAGSVSAGFSGKCFYYSGGGGGGHSIKGGRD